VHRFFMVISLLSISISSYNTAVAQAPQAASLAPIEQWRLAVLRGDAAALAQMFITSPQPQIEDVDGKAVTGRSEVSFWTAWKSKGLTDVQVEVSQDQLPQPNVRVIVAEVTLTVNTNGAEQKHYVGMALGWVQTGDGWRIAYLQRTDAARLRQSLEGKDLYPASADARKEIADAIHAATDTHKRVLLVFGGN
jgi:ketosteroid isomerase-like protein